MSDGPSLSDFMRHLQAILEDSEEIPNREDRETRQFQIESAIQEAILFGNRYKELLEHGIDPFHFVRSMSNDDHPQPVSKAESLSLGLIIVPAAELVLREILTSAPHVGQSGNHSSSCSSSSHWAMISRMIGSSASSL